MYCNPPFAGFTFNPSHRLHPPTHPPLPHAQAVTPNANSSTGLDTVKPMRPVGVAIMDSGVDCYHRDLNVVFNKSFVVPNQANDPTQDRNGCWDVYDHGTNVAGWWGVWGVVQ